MCAVTSSVPRSGQLANTSQEQTELRSDRVHVTVEKKLIRGIWVALPFRKHAGGPQICILRGFCATVQREREREGERERENSNSKIWVLKGSSVRSIWTYLTASPGYTTNTVSTTIPHTGIISTNKQLRERKREREFNSFLAERLRTRAIRERTSELKSGSWSLHLPTGMKCSLLLWVHCSAALLRMSFSCHRIIGVNTKNRIWQGQTLKTESDRGKH